MTRLLFHVQHLLGIGHQRRAELLVEGLVEAGFAVTVLSGGAPVEGEDWRGAALLPLPAVRSDGTNFSRLLDREGRPIDDSFRAERRRQVLAAHAAVRPDVLLIEGFPFARRQFRFELLPLLEAARAARPAPLIVTSIRDILVEKSAPATIAEVLSTIERFIDRVLVHGDPRIIDLARSFSAAPAIADRLAYTGYIAPDSQPTHRGARDGVLVSAGGGAVGVALMQAALAARPQSRLGDRGWHLLTGPNLPADSYESLLRGAPAGVTVERYRSDFPALLGRAELSISQAGYNTVLDVLAAGPRAIFVPFAAPGETEQSLRAQLLAEKGRALLVPEASLTPAALAAAIDRILSAPPPTPLALACGGAATSAGLLRQWLAASREDGRATALSS